MAEIRKYVFLITLIRISILNFTNEKKEILCDQFIQNWFSDINSSFSLKQNFTLKIICQDYRIKIHIG